MRRRRAPISKRRPTLLAAQDKLKHVSQKQLLTPEYPLYFPCQRRENLLLMDVRPAARSPQVRQQFWADLTGRVSVLPGVRGMALAGDAVFGNGGWNQTVWIARPGQAPRDASVSMNFVGPGFFATAGIPVLTGREFGEQDRENAPLVAVD